MKKILILITIVITSFCLTGCPIPVPDLDDLTVNGTVQDMVSGDWLQDVSISSDSISIGNIVTGSDGHFSFQINTKVKPIINLRAQKFNYKSNTQMLNLEQIKKSGNSIDFQLLRSSIIYTGSVIDVQTKQPINNAKVHAKIKKGSYIAAVSTVFSDENGHFFLELNDPGYDTWIYYITASQENYQVKTYTLNHSQVDVGKTFSLDFPLEKE